MTGEIRLAVEPGSHADVRTVRLDAVEEIIQSQPFQDTFDRLTKGMPDIERLLSRIHAGSCRVNDLFVLIHILSLKIRAD